VSYRAQQPKGEANLLGEASPLWKLNQSGYRLSDVGRYIIDRIENEWAALEDENATVFNVPVSWLPPEASEGDVVQASTEDPTSGTRTLAVYARSRSKIGPGEKGP